MTSAIPKDVPRDPRKVSLEFPTASAKSRLMSFFVVGILLGSLTTGAGLWVGLQLTAAPPVTPPTEVTVRMSGIAFIPQTVTVPVGTKVTWVNEDPTEHTVTSDAPGGSLQSGFVEPGGSFSYTFTTEGTYAYHCIPHSTLSQGRYQGMTGKVIVGSGVGGDGTPIDLPHETYSATTTAPPAGWHEWNFTLVAKELPLEVAPGVPYAAWTFNGTLPAPALRVRQGDRVNIRLVNDGTMNHSIDFHSARVPWNVAYRDVPPGQVHTYSFTADYPGVFMYHCGSAPVLAHVANGMYGVMIVDPLVDARPVPDVEYVLVLSEVYASDTVNADRVFFGDFDKMLAVEPTQVVFNGYAFQYHPGLGGEALPAKPGERIRLYVLNAGPSLVQSFHVIGAIFDRVYIENNPANELIGIQTWTLPASGGAAFDLIIPDAGLYPFVTHNFAYTGLGAIGVIQVAP